MTKEERVHRQEKMFSFIEQWQRSNLPQHTFCKDQGITYTTFYYWLKRYRSQQEETGGFMAMRINSTRDNYIELRYPNGVVMQIPSTIGLTALKQLIRL